MKKEVCLSDAKLVDDQENTAETKRKRKQAILTVIQPPKATTPVSLNWIGLTRSAPEYFEKLALKKAKHPTLGSCISYTRTNSKFSSRQRCFCTLYPGGYTVGASTSYNPWCCCQRLEALKELLIKKYLYLLIKKDLLISFMKVSSKTKMLKWQKTIQARKCQKTIQAIKKVTGKFRMFFLVKILIDGQKPF